MSSNQIARVLSTQQRQCLIDHAQGPQPFLAVGDGQTNGLRATKQCLIDLKLLRSTDSPLNPRPSELELTPLGQEVVCLILGRMVDVLVYAGFLDPLTAHKVSAAIVEASLFRKGIHRQCADHMLSHADAIREVPPAKNIVRDRVATIALLSMLKKPPALPAEEETGP